MSVFLYASHKLLFQLPCFFHLDRKSKKSFRRDPGGKELEFTLLFPFFYSYFREGGEDGQAMSKTINENGRLKAQ